MLLRIMVVSILFVLGMSCSETQTSDDYYGKMLCDVTRVIDGDTIECNIPGWPDIIGKEIKVRSLQYDTPEIFGRVKDCERELGYHAKDFVLIELESADIVTLDTIQRGSFFRLVANIKYLKNGKWRLLGRELYNHDLAILYENRKDHEWC